MKVHSTLPPTAAPIPIGALAAGAVALVGGRPRATEVAQELAQWQQAAQAFLVSSGKAALAIILTALASTSSRRKVIIPAYTCYSVPSAVVKAGLEIVPCDVDPTTLDFNLTCLETLLDEQTLCVISTHLFGLSADVEAVLARCRPKGIVVVEDAAQAMGGTRNGKLVGSLGLVGLFSLGRGKNVSCGGGGVIVTSSRELAAAIQLVCETTQQESVAGAAVNWAELLATSFLIRPSLYWLPAGLPFLGLGETKFYRDFPIERMSDARAAALTGWQGRLEQDNRTRREQAELFIKELAASAPSIVVLAKAESVYLRLPVLVADRPTKEWILRESSLRGLGVSGAYPDTITHIPELAGSLLHYQDAGARLLVDRLVTVPTHRYVSASHRAAIGRLFAEAADRSGETTLSTTQVHSVGTNHSVARPDQAGASAMRHTQTDMKV